MSNRPLLLDACVAINLVAADDIDQIARYAGWTFSITRQAAREVSYLRDTTEAEVIEAPIDLRRHVAADAFEIIDLTTDEIRLYVELAGVVDDGEASTIAVALGRGMPLATDDRKARRVCSERGLPEPTGTIALIRQYCEARALDGPEVSSLLARIRSRASFQPPRGDPDLKWWSEHEPTS